MKGTQQAEYEPDQPNLSRMSRSSVAVHIEELVLHGFASGDRRRIAVAVERELARLMSESGVPRSRNKNLAIEQVSGGSFHAKRPVKPQTTGMLIARTVYESFRHEPSTHTAGTGSPKDIQNP